MSEYFKEYLKKINFNKYLVNLKKKLKHKKVIIYGTGMLFQYIYSNYDLSDINIIGISDIKFSEEHEGEQYLGQRIIPKNSILKYDVDVILVASENYLDLIEDIEQNLTKETKIKVLPLARKRWFDVIKIIWQTI